MVVTEDPATTRQTLDLEAAAARLGVGRTLAYQQARQHGHLAGVPVLRVGRRYLVPMAALERVLNGTEAITN